ncbi:MAG: rhombotarget lipoprotein [Proteobacteria bacterium]|nr:rhombotarget lipoprotein [Pseudomonadota bacterium]
MPLRLLLALLVFLLGGCASWLPQGQVKQTASVMDFLFGAKADKTVMQPESTTTLRLPVRVGIAFVPSGALGRFVPETEQLQMLNRVRDAFSQRGYIGGIEVIPNTYLRPGGGFTNLEQAARMFNVDVIALLSYDQTQFNDSNALSVLYWTIIGAYVVHGDQFDIHTMVEATVFDVASRKLLFRAPGVSNVKGSAALATFSDKSRAARVEGFNNAVASMIPNLQRELDGFQQRVKTDATVKIENRPGYTGGGAIDIAALAALLVLALVLRRRLHA